MTEFGIYEEIEALNQLRQMMAPDQGFLKVIFLRSPSAELLIMLVTVSCILRLFTVYPNCKKNNALHENLHALSGIGRNV